MPLKKPLQILHVDDSSLLRKTISRGLEPFKEFYELTQAESVDEALSLLASGKIFDVILTDWVMNGKNGLTFLCTLKADPVYHHLPVFFLTSEYQSSSLVTAVTYGASGILKKPITGSEVHAYLQKKISVIEESHAAQNDSFAVEAKQLLNEIQVLFLKNEPDLTTCMQYVQNLAIKARSAKWPLLADYCQKIDDTIQLTLSKNVKMLNPMKELLEEFHSFMVSAVTEIEHQRPHQFLSEEIEKNLKDYHIELEAGRFVDGVLIPWEVLTELQQYLSADGHRLLAPYLNTKKKAS